MRVQVRKADTVSIVDCSGDVDHFTSSTLRATLLAELQSGVQSVLLNMTDIEYIDSSGIGTLVEGLQLSRQTRTRFGLFGLRPNARAVLEIAHLDKVFNLFENEQQALEKIALIPPFGGS
jgi:anti-sigma B factor antagonist